MKKKILLIEPNYKNKYPPLGLMKISAYHKLKGDDVIFYKGCTPELRDQRWDRVYITTLFSFHWKKTKETILYYKRSVKRIKDFFVGGILATTMFNEIIEETGIEPFKGLLDKPGILGRDNIIIDNLTPDYDILDDIEYIYPTNNSYITYMTRGCCNKCPFCAVPLLEPNYNNYISIKEQIEEVDRKYGQKRDLLLMDNNVLASDEFDKIIDEIIELGFSKGAKYIEPNLFEVMFNRLILNKNDKKAKDKLKTILYEFIKDRLISKPEYEQFMEFISKFGLLDEANNKHGKRYVTRLKKAFPLINPIYEKYRNKTLKARYIDFNQGIDARKLTESKMKRLSELNIRPMRIAFDDIKFKVIYISKIRLAAKFGINNLSNYVLYNYIDTPAELYERLKINIELNEELGISLFSFPMKYIPITDKNRNHIGEHWNRKYLRTIQVILNVTNGAVMPRKGFFEKAFGKNLEEFNELLLMPEDYIYYRFYAEEKGFIKKWKTLLNKLTDSQLDEAKLIIYMNSFHNLPELFIDDSVLKFLSHYQKRIEVSDYRSWKKKRNLSKKE